jgi:hypothetical protein
MEKGQVLGTGAVANMTLAFANSFISDAQFEGCWETLWLDFVSGNKALSWFL